VPIPNTAVKPAEPMILLPRESRSPPALNKAPPGLERRPGVLFCGRGFERYDRTPVASGIGGARLEQSAAELRFDRGTLLLSGRSVAGPVSLSRSEPWTWDERVGAWRCLAVHFAELRDWLRRRADTHRF